MPNGDRSFYIDTAAGKRYGTFMLEELPATARAFFPLSDRREDAFVAGLSMGGYGAFRLALSRPDLFAAAGSFSGALDMAFVARHDPDPGRLAEWRHVFGDLDRLPGSELDLFALAQRMPATERKRLRLFQCCGTDDLVYPGNVRFRDHARSAGLDLTYEEGPGGHEWGYWDRAIERFLGWIGGASAPPGGAAGSR
jgi:S-formylglutathione hydrolase FrmB